MFSREEEKVMQVLPYPLIGFEPSQLAVHNELPEEGAEGIVLIKLGQKVLFYLGSTFWFLVFSVIYAYILTRM